MLGAHEKKPRNFNQLRGFSRISAAFWKGTEKIYGVP